MEAQENKYDYLDALKSQNVTGKGYNVPQGYFEQFTANLAYRVQQADVAEETDRIAPLLNSISRKQPFAVPEGYFANDNPVPDGLLDNNGDKIGTPYEVPADYFASFTGKLQRQVRKKPAGFIVELRRHWAIAASTIGIILMGSLYFLTGQQTDLVSEKGLDRHISKMSNEQLEHFLGTENTNATGTIGAAGLPVDFNQYFEPVADSELKQFLEESAGEE